MELMEIMMRYAQLFRFFIVLAQPLKQAERILVLYQQLRKQAIADEGNMSVGR